MNIEEIENIDIDFDIDEVIEEMLNVGVNDTVQEIVLAIVDYTLTKYDYNEAKRRCLKGIPKNLERRVSYRMYKTYVDVTEYPIVKSLIDDGYTTALVINSLPSVCATLMYLESLVKIYLERVEDKKHIAILERDIAELKQNQFSENLKSLTIKQGKKECAKYLRKTCKWKQHEVSNYLQVSLPTIKRWEKAWKTANTSK